MSEVNWLSASIFLFGNVILTIGIFRESWFMVIGGFLIALLCEIDTGIEINTKKGSSKIK